MRASFALTVLLAIGCRAQASSRPPELPATSRIVVHATMDAPAGIAIREGVAISGASPSPAGKRDAKPLAAAEGFPAELPCPMRTACVVVVRKRVLAVVFAFDPVVEIDVSLPPPGPSPFVVPHYRDAKSESAALGALLRDASALQLACTAGDEDRIAKLRRALQRRAKRDRRPLVRESARLALVTEHCGTTADFALARTVIAEIDPTSPSLSLWTQGLVRAAAQLGFPRDAMARIETAIAEHPDPDVGAFLLMRLAYAAEQLEDADAAAKYDRRLAEPRFASTQLAWYRRFELDMRAPLRVGPGDALPAIVLPPIDGTAAFATADVKAPQLLYFSASWCKGCVASLPKLRSFADAHPDVRIVYVLWDSPEDARAFIRDQAPVPGTVVQADPTTRTAIQSAFFKVVALPTFVLADAEGRIVATSLDHELADLAEALAGAPSVARR
jgi:thiol-disulfide isomerase/thioredoxin